MNFPRLVFAVLVAPLLVLLALSARPAAAETLTCTDVTTLPLTISSSGHYCLNKNFSQAFAGAAITINANNVVLDCNDHVVINTSPGVTGVYASNRFQVTVRNCGLVAFGRGIAFYETGSGLSRNNRILGNEVRKSKIAGIQVAGSANLIEGNRVTDNTGGTGSYTYGILLSSYTDTGVGNVIRNNIITNIAPSVYVRITGIYLLDVDNNAIIGNTVSALFPPLDLGAYGIIGSSTSVGNAAVGNTILSHTGNPPGGGGGLDYSGASYDGITFLSATTTATHNVCRANVVGHWYSNILVESASAGCVKDLNTEF